MKKIILRVLKSIAKKFDHKIIDNRNINIIEANNTEKEFLNISKKYSLTNIERLWSLLNAIKYVKNFDVKGDFVECGVWRGGNLILFEMMRKSLNLKQTIFGYDTFSGMTNPTDNDMRISGNVMASKILNEQENKKYEGDNIWCFASLDEVKKNISDNVDLSNNIHLVKGPVEETLLIEDNLPKKISILRLDTDFYESTKIELEILYPRLSENGILIIDDYGCWSGAKKAVDEFFKNKKVIMHLIDEECRLIYKNHVN